MLIYNPVLAPWVTLATEAPHVINLRLSLLPWLQWTNPLLAHNEMHRMISEKEEAYTETLIVMSQAPVRYWMDVWSACFSLPPGLALMEGFVKSSKRAARPSQKRVTANQRRLSGG